MTLAQEKLQETMFDHLPQMYDDILNKDHEVKMLEKALDALERCYTARPGIRTEDAEAFYQKVQEMIWDAKVYTDTARDELGQMQDEYDEAAVGDDRYDI